MLILLIGLGLMAAAHASAEGWVPVREVEGVAVEARPTDSGYHEHRGEAAVCAEMGALEDFVADTSRFADWIPYTRSARLLDASGSDFVYYVRSTTPWPLKDRDMVYQITRHSETEDGVAEGVHLSVLGLPDYHPEEKNVTRIREAAGQWHLLQQDDGIDVSYQLYVHPGSVPAFAANRRLATVVGKTLANLAAQFPCAQI